VAPGPRDWRGRPRRPVTARAGRSVQYAATAPRGPHASPNCLNVHIHILALDGVYTFRGERPRFHRATPPAAEELERLLDTLICRTSLYSTHGALLAQEYDDEEQLWLDLDPAGGDALIKLQDASIRYRIAVGPIAWRNTLRLHTPGAALEGREQTKPFTTARDGFSLNAAVA